MLQAGFGHVDITPTPVDGPEGFRVFDPIGFRAIVLRQGNAGVALVTGDFFSFEENLLALTREALRGVPWLDPANILVSVSHIGGAPVLFPSYVHQPCRHLRAFGQEAYFAGAAAEAVRLAMTDLKPSRLGFGSADASGLHYNRRSFDADGKLVMSNFMLPYPRSGLRYQGVDERVYVVRFDAAEDAYLPAPRGALMVFGCHALCNSDKSGHVSADYPGSARRVVEEAWPGAAVAFAPGAIGDVVPFHRGGRTYQAVGNAVGGAALYALERTATRGDVTMTVTRRTVRVPTFARQSLQEATASYAGKEGDGTLRMNLHTARRAAERPEAEYTLTAVKVGDGLLLHLPGELFAGTAEAIRAASRTPHTVILSGPSADVGYLCPQEAHEQGGMEPQYTAVTGEAEAIVRRAACELVR